MIALWEKGAIWGVSWDRKTSWTKRESSCSCSATCGVKTFRLGNYPFLIRKSDIVLVYLSCSFVKDICQGPWLRASLEGWNVVMVIYSINFLAIGILSKLPSHWTLLTGTNKPTKMQDDCNCNHSVPNESTDSLRKHDKKADNFAEKWSFHLLCCLPIGHKWFFLLYYRKIIEKL